MKLIYVADPMCSWCYGFGRSLDALLADPREAAPLSLAIVMGGLRPYAEEPLTGPMRDEILTHWHHVHEASGQPFAEAPRTAMHAPGFVYDTEPASRATLTVRSHWPRLTWRYLKAVQQAFYAQARDITQPAVLADVAEGLGIERAAFAAAFASEALREATRGDFAQSQAWGIRGFPALIAEHGDELHLVCHGFVDEKGLRARLASFQAATRPSDGAAPARDASTDDTPD
jgi:putative protein-disulfide isomerase